MKKLLLGCAVAALVSTASQADVLTWDMSGGIAVQPVGVTLGTTQNFISDIDSVAINAAGHSGTFNNNVDLFEKDTGGDEVGLGLVLQNDSDHEIVGAGFIVVDLRNAIAAGATSFGIKMDSATAPDAWDIVGTNDFSHFTVVLPGTDESSHNGLPIFKFYIFEATSGDVLLQDITAVIPSAVPEPSTWGMMLLGFLGLGAAFRRKLRLA